MATNVGGLAEQVVEGVSGALAPPEDVAGFSDAVERVLANLDELARNAKEHTPTWRSVVDALMPLVRDSR